MSPVRIVLGNSSLASYPQGGGHWTVFLQYLLGLEALGHDPFWLEVLPSTGDRDRDEWFIGSFFERWRRYGVSDRCALLWCDGELDQLTLRSARAYGKGTDEIAEIARSADLLWNFCGALRQPLLSLFRRRVFVDLDPGHLQISALTWDLGLRDHDVFLTVGGKLHDADCTVPTLGRTWHPFTPFVYLPMWDAAPDPGCRAPFSSVTHWTWAELWLDDRVISISKRDAYLGSTPRNRGRVPG